MEAEIDLEEPFQEVKQAYMLSSMGNSSTQEAYPPKTNSIAIFHSKITFSLSSDWHTLILPYSHISPDSPPYLYKSLDIFSEDNTAFPVSQETLVEYPVESAFKSLAYIALLPRLNVDTSQLKFLSPHPEKRSKEQFTF